LGYRTLVPPSRSPHFAAALGAALLLLAGCTFGRPIEPPPEPPRAPARAVLGCVDDRGRDVIRRTNAERTRRSLRALEPDARLQEAAQRHASDMARGDFMAHEGSDRSTVSERAARAGYRWTTVAENVAAGYPDPPTVVSGWMTSPGHRANILAADVQHVGIGYAYRTDTTMHHYWVMVFGATEGIRATPPECD
jgi:uncharacterized protein YkwD